MPERLTSYEVSERYPDDYTVLTEVRVDSDGIMRGEVYKRVEDCATADQLFGEVLSSGKQGGIIEGKNILPERLGGLF